MSAILSGLGALKSVKDIGFVEFTTDLVKNVYEVIVDSAMDQMKAYAELVEEVSKPLATYQKEVTGIELSKTYSELLGDEESSVKIDSYITDVLKLTVGETDNNISLGESTMDVSNHFGGVTIDNNQSIGSSITESNGDSIIEKNDLRKFVIEKLKETTSESYNMLVTILKLGLQKVVVTDGNINTKLTFDVKALDSTSKSSQKIDSSAKSWGVSGGISARWGKVAANISGGYSSSKISVNVVNENSNSIINMNANIVGGVSINFKTETFPGYEPEIIKAV